MSALQQAYAAWEKANKGWDADLPDPESLAEPIEVVADEEDGRRVRDTRRAVPVPPVDRHGLPVPGDKKPRKRNKKIVNLQLLRHDSSEEERAGNEAFQAATAARIARNSAYVLAKYSGKYSKVLELLLQGMSNPQIAKIVGKSDRRIQQIVHGNFSKGRKAQPGLEHFINKLMRRGVPTDFQSPAPVLVPMPVVVQPVKALKKSLQKEAVLGQLGWDFEMMGVAA